MPAGPSATGGPATPTTARTSTRTSGRHIPVRSKPESWTPGHRVVGVTRLGYHVHMLKIGLKRVMTTAVLVLFASAAIPAPADEPSYPELPNFHKVDDGLFRGGQPTAGGIARLKELGVRTIVNLRHEPKRVQAEEKEALEAGLRYFSVPMYGLSPPTGEQVTRVLALFGDPDNWPVFVH